MAQSSHSVHDKPTPPSFYPLQYIKILLQNISYFLCAKCTCQKCRSAPSLVLAQFDKAVKSLKHANYIKIIIIKNDALIPRGSLEGAFTIFRHLKHFSEAFYLKENNFLLHLILIRLKRGDLQRAGDKQPHKGQRKASSFFLC